MGFNNDREMKKYGDDKIEDFTLSKAPEDRA